jgi:protein CMS1
MDALQSAKPKKPRKARGRKRKLDDQDNVDNPSKRTALLVPSDPKPEEVDGSIAMMNPSLLADHFAKCVRRCCSEKSEIEFEDDYLPTKSFLDTTTFDRVHTSANLPAFLEQFTENGKAALSTCEEKAAPHTLVVTSSGIRTASLNRTLRAFNTEESKVAKLIAKHMKIGDNAAYMQRTKVGIAIGTPARLKDLIDQDAFRTSGIRRIVVDGSYRDEKKRTIFEMAELFRPLIGLLNTQSIRQRYGSQDDKVDLLVY